MAKKRKPKKEDKEQSRRFVETARKLEYDESGEAFHRAVLKAKIKKGGKSSAK